MSIEEIEAREKAATAESLVIWSKRKGFQRQIEVAHDGCFVLGGDEYVEWQASYNAVLAQLKVATRP